MLPVVPPKERGDPFTPPDWASCPASNLRYSLVSEGDVQETDLSSRPSWVIGCSQELAQINSFHDSVSRQHAALSYHLGTKSFYLIDLKSFAGTFCDNVKIPAYVATKVGLTSKIRFGNNPKIYSLKLSPVLKPVQVPVTENLLGVPGTQQSPVVEPSKLQEPEQEKKIRLNQMKTKLEFIDSTRKPEVPLAPLPMKELQQEVPPPVALTPTAYDYGITAGIVVAVSAVLLLYRNWNLLVGASVMTFWAGLLALMVIIFPLYAKKLDKYSNVVAFLLGYIAMYFGYSAFWMLPFSLAILFAPAETIQKSIQKKFEPELDSSQNVIIRPNRWINVVLQKILCTVTDLDFPELDIGLSSPSFKCLHMSDEVTRPNGFEIIMEYSWETHEDTHITMRIPINLPAIGEAKLPITVGSPAIKGKVRFDGRFESASYKSIEKDQDGIDRTVLKSDKFFALGISLDHIEKIHVGKLKVLNAPKLEWFLTFDKVKSLVHNAINSGLATDQVIVLLFDSTLELLGSLKFPRKREITIPNEPEKEIIGERRDDGWSVQDLVHDVKQCYRCKKLTLDPFLGCCSEIPFEKVISSKPQNEPMEQIKMDHPVNSIQTHDISFVEPKIKPIKKADPVLTVSNDILIPTQQNNPVDPAPIFVTQQTIINKNPKPLTTSKKREPKRKNPIDEPVLVPQEKPKYSFPIVSDDDHIPFPLVFDNKVDTQSTPPKLEENVIKTQAPKEKPSLPTELAPVIQIPDKKTFQELVIQPSSILELPQQPSKEPIVEIPPEPRFQKQMETFPISLALESDLFRPIEIMPIETPIFVKTEPVLQGIAADVEAQTKPVEPHPLEVPLETIPYKIPEPSPEPFMNDPVQRATLFEELQASIRPLPVNDRSSFVEKLPEPIEFKDPIQIQPLLSKQEMILKEHINQFNEPNNVPASPKQQPIVVDQPRSEPPQKQKESVKRRTSGFSSGSSGSAPGNSFFKTNINFGNTSTPKIFQGSGLVPVEPPRPTEPPVQSPRSGDTIINNMNSPERKPPIRTSPLVEVHDHPTSGFKTSFQMSSQPRHHQPSSPPQSTTYHDPYQIVYPPHQPSPLSFPDSPSHFVPSQAPVSPSFPPIHPVHAIPSQIPSSIYPQVQQVDPFVPSFVSPLSPSVLFSPPTSHSVSNRPFIADQIASPKLESRSQPQPIIQTNLNPLEDDDDENYPTLGKLSF